MGENSSMRDTYYKHLRKQIDFGRGLKRVASEKTVLGLQQGQGLFSASAFQEVFDAWDRRRLFVWSDHHLFHRNICQYAGRPFDSLFRMHEVFLENAQNTLSIDDVVLWGGDVSFGVGEQTQEIMKQIPGKHFLILGNHDVDRKEKLNNISSLFLGVTDCLTLRFGHYNLWLSHYPILKEDVPDQTICVHGHTHQHAILGPFANMCVEHTNYTPFLLHELVKQHHSYIGCN